MSCPLAVTHRINGISLLLFSESTYIGGGLAVVVVVETLRTLLNVGRFPSRETAIILKESGYRLNPLRLIGVGSLEC